MNILVAGGMGFIGSHTVVELVAAGHEVVIVDNLANSDVAVLGRLRQIMGRDVPFEQVDLCDRDALAGVFQKYSFDAVIHFAGLKAVGESVTKPLLYYRTNLLSTLNLCELMHEYHVKKLVFSSSATVYGHPDSVPITETAPLRPINPYGHTKAMIEQMLMDLAVGDSEVQVTLLRYFNPIGAHESGLIGEDPQGLPNNLFPFIARVASGQYEKLQVFGDDYDTPDGTAIRDYIHVVDLARGHLAALQHMPVPGTYEVYNLGTGHGCSVLESIAAFEKACGHEIAYEVVARRAGDSTASYADVAKANQALGWQATKTLDESCADIWRWQQYIAQHQS